MILTEVSAPPAASVPVRAFAEHLRLGKLRQYPPARRDRPWRLSLIIENGDRASVQ